VVPVSRLWHLALGADGRARRHARARDAQLPEAFERLAVATRSGRSVGAALEEVAASTAPPLGPELAAATVAVAAGVAVEQALEAWAGDDPTPDLLLATTALALGARAGGEVARACDRVAATLRERRELRAEARALSTQARASAGVLTVAPLAFAALVSALEPGVVAFLLTEPAGLACLATGLGLDGLGAAWMTRIVDRAL
jgi:tight adherence protein B